MSIVRHPFNMKLSLEVLASASIKRKKPWPRIIWIGEEYESLLLIDEWNHRLSVLYVPSGKTKRKISKLSPFIEDAVAINSTNNGHFLIGVQQHGEVFVWFKDKDVIKKVPGLEGVVKAEDLRYGKTSVYASNDCHHIIVMLGTDQIFVWGKQGSEPFLQSASPEVKGLWTRVNVPSDIVTPRNMDSREFGVDIIFYSHQSLGHCCQLSMVYNSDADVSIVTLLLRFNRPLDFSTKSAPTFNVEWTVIKYPFKHIQPNFQRTDSRGAFKMKYANNGQMIAIAANQNQPKLTSMLFVSPLTDTVLTSSMSGCGVRNKRSSRGRNFWVADMAWTSDDLFLVCIMKSGCVCLMSRLGEPLLIETSGQKINLGPSYYLGLHPLQIISADDHGRVFSADGRPVSPSSETSDLDSQRQRFSVTTHPSLPIVLFSDGFMVTILQMSPEITNQSLMQDFIMTSSRHLKDIIQRENIDMSNDAYSFPSHRDFRTGKPPSGRKKKPFHFEEPETALNSTIDSESSIIDENKALDRLSQGKIIFTECDSTVVDPDNFSGLSRTEYIAKRLNQAEACLFNSWKLAVSTSEMWTSDIENLTKLISHNFIKLFAVLLKCPEIDGILSRGKKVPSDAQNTRLFSVVQRYRRAMELLRFDLINQHLMYIAFKFVHNTLTLMLHDRDLQQTDPRIKTLSGCYALLKFTETIINRVYVWVPKDSSYTGLPPESHSEQKHAYEPAILMKAQLSPRSVAREIIYADPRTLGLDQQQQLPGKRLCGSWKLLFKHLVGYQSQLHKFAGHDKDKEQLRNLVFAVEQIIHQIDGNMPHLAPPKISQGEKFSLDGQHTMAVDAWRNQLHNLPGGQENNEKMANALHSILYTYITKGELGQAVDFVDSLVVQASVSQSVTDQLPQSQPGMTKPSLMTIVTHTIKSKGSVEEQMVPCIRNKSLRQLVQTMARFMAAYFTNETVYIFPPHSPLPLPAIHMGMVTTNNRIIPKYHEEINNLVAKEGLSKIWTTERALEYLLLSGLVCEATWFAERMGDWKAAYLLSVACTTHRGIAPHLYKKKRKPLQLPETLLPESILKQKLEALIHLDKRGNVGKQRPKESKQDFIPIDNETNIVQLSRTVEDIITAGIISDVEVVSWLLSNLVERLTHTVSSFSPLVPQDFYLPAPPLYCPQPAETSQEKQSAEVEREKRLRFQASSLIQLILVVFNSSHTSLPALRWYIQELVPIQERASQFKSTTEGPCLEIPEVLQQFGSTKSSLIDFQDVVSVGQVLNSFRDFMTVVWLLHSRDKLSYNVRIRENHIKNVNYEDYVRDSWESKEGEKWTKECFTALQWAVHMLTFSRFLPDEGCIYKVMLSLLLELSPTEDTADILAEHFYDAENLDVEVQEKLDKFLSDWQSVFIEPEDDGKSAKPETQDPDDENDGRKSVTFFQASPRGKTLSVYFSKQCEVVLKVLKKKRKIFGAYEEFVFDHSGRVPPGSMTSSLPPEKSGFCIGSRPFETKVSYIEFLDTFCAICFTKILDMENSNSKVPLMSPFLEAVREQEFQDLAKRLKQPSQKSNLVMMSSAHGKQQRNEAHVDSSKTGANRGKSMYGNGATDSHTEMSKENEAHPQNRGKTNMTELASKFSQSDDLLYKDDGGSEDHPWSLDVDVDFGTRYTALQNLLNWLSLWGQKQHSLGLQWKGEKDLEFRPTMKIDVSTKLVVLALWLLENKYSPVKRPESRTPVPNDIESLERQNDAKRSIEGLIDEMNAQVKEAMQQRSQPERRPKHRRNHRKPSPQSPSVSRSWDNEYDQDTEEIKTAYEEVLNGKEDSSSLEVSSLEPDEYGDDLRTLTLIKGSQSMQKSYPRQGSQYSSGRRKSPSPNRRDISTFDRTYYRSPKRNHPQSPTTSTPVSRRSRNRTRDTESRPDSHAHYQDNMGYGGDLAQQLQNVVRGELRRMLEAQHRSMIAMMGVLDGPGYSSQDFQSYPNQQMSRRPRSPSRESSPRRQSRSTMVREELDFVEEQRRPLQHRSPNRGNVLHELQNLQDTTSRRQHSISPTRGRSRLQRSQEAPLGMSPHGNRYDQNEQLIHSQRISQQNAQQENDVNIIPRFLRVTAEKDTNDPPVRFPIIPVPAWTPQQSQVDQNIPPIPLLQLDRAHAQPYPGVQRAQHLPQFAPSSSAPPTRPPQQGSIPPAPSQQSQTTQLSEYIGMKLLQILPEERPFLGPHNEPNFGRLLDPSLLVGHDQLLHQQEMQKYKHAQDFFKQQAEHLEEMERHQLGSQLLQANLQEQMTNKRDHQKREIKKKTKKGLVQKRESASESEIEKVSVMKESAPVVDDDDESEEISTPGEEIDENKVHDGYAIKQETEVAEKTESSEGATENIDSSVDDGFMIKPGSFDNYLEMEEKDFEADTNARVQYRTAMIMKKQRAVEKRRKVDFSTMTKNYEDAQIGTGASLEAESIRTAEAATSITKDTGVDPIQEAIVEYNRARQGNALPPDIYLGLRFGDTDGQPDVAAYGQEKPKGRSYLNVVDLDASAVLQDLSKKPEKEEKVQQDLGFTPQAVTLTSARGDDQGIAELEASMRDALQPKAVPGQRAFKQDSVTVRMFESEALGRERVSIAVMPRDSVQGSRGAIIERLRDMGRQMSAIDQMSSNIERDFHSTRLMINTLEQLNTVDESLVHRDEEKVQDTDAAKKKLTPKSSSKSPAVSARSARTTARSRSEKMASSAEDGKLSTELVKMSGLSGISDIIGEMVEKGEIDLEEAGFSENEAINLASRLKTSARSAHSEEEQMRIRRSLEILKKMSVEAKTEEEKRDREEEKAQLKAWMLEKRYERMKDYKQHRADLREHERRPFKPDESAKYKTTGKLFDKDRKTSEKENVRQRLRDAQHLLGDILKDKPELPPDVPLRERSPKRKKSPPRDKSPKQYGRTFVQRQRDISPKRQTVTISPEVKRKEYEPHTSMQETEDVHYWSDIQHPVKTPVKAPVISKSRKEPSVAKENKAPYVPRLKLVDSDDFLQKTTETTGEFSAYARAVEEMDVSISREFTPKPRQALVQRQSEEKPPKQKSLKDLVRLQRPEVTRKGPASKIPVPYVKRLAGLSARDSDSARELTLEEQRKIYGSSRLPDQNYPSASRHVKTYAERLQDMKSKQTYTTPIVPRSATGGPGSVRRSQETIYRKPVGPRHKPQTYVEQLQKLNKGTHKASTRRTVKQQTFLRSHKPAHRPLTYVEQLKGLQPPPRVVKRTQRISPSRSHMRTRPYADPYTHEGETWERDSVLSDWSVDDNVKRLLYEDDTSSAAVGMSIDYTVSEGVSDYYDYVMGDEYIGSVDIDEIAQIADAASVGSGSVMSVIDWDAVDDLIADVK